MDSKFLEIRIGKIMQSKNLPLVGRDMPIEEVLPFPKGRSHVWVVDDKEHRKVIGVITEHDILDILSPSRFPYDFGLPDMRHLEEGTAEEVMTKGVIKCSVDDTVREVLDKMTKHEIRRLPAVSNEDVIEGEVHLKHITNRFAEIIKKRK